MQLKEFTADDYETCAQWWSGHGWEPVPAVVLPKLGMMVVDDEAPICAAWLYMDNSVGVSMLEWLVTNRPGNQDAGGIHVGPGEGNELRRDAHDLPSAFTCSNV